MAEKVKIALAQMTVSEDREANMVKGEGFIARAGEQEAALVAFPEMSFDPFFPQYPGKEEFFNLAEKVPGPTTERFAEVAKEKGIPVLINLLQEVERAQYFDATVVLEVDGSIAGYTQMMHICETPGFHEKYYYWPGTTPFPVFDLGAVIAGPCICYDRHFPEVMRSLTLHGADVIVVQTATSREEAGQVLEAEMQAAALANGVFIALVNRAGRDGRIDFAGRSFVVGPFGNIINQSTSHGDDLLVTEIDLADIKKARHAWPFLRDRRPEIYGDLLGDLDGEY